MVKLKRTVEKKIAKFSIFFAYYSSSFSPVIENVTRSTIFHAQPCQTSVYLDTGEWRCVALSALPVWLSLLSDFNRATILAYILPFHSVSPSLCSYNTMKLYIRWCHSGDAIYCRQNYTYPLTSIAFFSYFYFCNLFILWRSKSQ